MTSSRRTQSPYSDRSLTNGSNSPFSVQSPSQKLIFNGRPTMSPVSRFIAGIFLQKQHNSRKSGYFSWRKSILRCLLFILLGFVFGMWPFGNDLKNSDLSFELNTPPLITVDDSLSDVVSEKVKGTETVVEPVEFADRSVYDISRKQLIAVTPTLITVDYSLSDVVSEKVKGTETVVEPVEFADRSVYDIPRKQLIAVTPTYNRALQAYYLNRLGQVLRLVKPQVLWIVVELNVASTETAEILRNMGVMYRHLVCAKNSTHVKDRGVHQRNTALEHIERHKLDGIVYFADDDNIYSLELFESMREISRFGTWPVGMLAQRKNKASLEGPVRNESQVIGWHTNEKSKRLRRFHVDMSGFAFNSTILWDPKRWHRPTSDAIRQLDTMKEGFQETSFIEQIVEDESQMEGVPLVEGCSKIMNWHLHLEARGLVYPNGWILEKNLDVVLPSK